MAASPSIWTLIRSDWHANRANRKSRVILVLFRLLHPLATGKRFTRLACLPLRFAYQVAVEWLLCVELPLKTEVGGGLRIAHGYALVINDRVCIGQGCTLRQCTTIGVKSDGPGAGAPILGDDVDVGANVVILGNITIGDGARIGAGSVVVKNVPAGSTVAGNPARELRKTGPGVAGAR